MAAKRQNINKLMFSGVWNGGVGGWSRPSLPHPKNLIPLFLNFGELMFCGGGWVGGPRPFRGSWKKQIKTRTFRMSNQNFRKKPDQTLKREQDRSEKLNVLYFSF